MKLSITYFQDEEWKVELRRNLFWKTLKIPYSHYNREILTDLVLHPTYNAVTNKNRKEIQKLSSYIFNGNITFEK